MTVQTFAGSTDRRRVASLAMLVVRQELSMPAVVTAAAVGGGAAGAALLFEQSLYGSPYLTPELVDRMFGVRSVVPLATGVIAAWFIGLGIMRRVADDGSRRWLDPIVGGGGSRSAYAGAVWLGAVCRGVLLYATVVMAVTVLDRVTGNANANFPPRMLTGAVAVLLDTAAYALLCAVLVRRRRLGPAVALAAASLPVALMMASVAGYLPGLPVTAIRALTLHIPFPIQRGPWGHVAYQLAHAALLLSLAVWLAPRRVARGG